MENEKILMRLREIADSGRRLNAGFMIATLQAQGLAIALASIDPPEPLPVFELKPMPMYHPEENNFEPAPSKFIPSKQNKPWKRKRN